MLETSCVCVFNIKIMKLKARIVKEDEKSEIEKEEKQTWRREFEERRLKGEEERLNREDDSRINSTLKNAMEEDIYG